MVWTIRLAGWLEPVELRAWDQLLRWRPISEAGPDRVALVLVGEEDIQRYGHPLSDGLLADLVASLIESGATAVGVDLYRDRPVEPGHAALRDLVLAEDRVIMVEKLPGPALPGVAAPPYLRDEAARGRVGFSDLVVDPDGVVRRNLLFAWDAAGRPHPSLSLLLALRHLQDLGISLEADPGQPERLLLGPARLSPLDGDEGGYVRADARGYQILLDYGGTRTPRPVTSLRDWLEGRTPRDRVRGRVVLVGTRAPSVRDDLLTPVGDPTLAAAAPGAGARPVAVGAVVHAAATDQLLRLALDGAPLPTAWSETATAAAVAALALLGAALGVGLRSPWGVAATVAAVSLGSVGAAVGAAARAIWVSWPPFVLVLVTAAVAGVAAVSQRERAQRAFLQQLFGRYLPAEVVDHLRAHRGEFLRDGRPIPQRLTETVLMMDVEGSSVAAGRLDSEAFLRWIDRGLGALARTAEEHGGIVEYFSGDGLKVDFGVPIARREPAEVAEDARRAVRAALAARAVLGRLNAEAREAGEPPMRVRMGIHTGETVAGSIGSERRLQYTTLGQAANLAARLEEFDKESFRDDPAAPDCRILVSEVTRGHLEGPTGGPTGGPKAGLTGWRLRPVGSIPLPGTARRLAVLELLDAGGDATGDDPVAADDDGGLRRPQ